MIWTEHSVGHEVSSVFGWTKALIAKTTVPFIFREAAALIAIRTSSLVTTGANPLIADVAGIRVVV